MENKELVYYTKETPKKDTNLKNLSNQELVEIIKKKEKPLYDHTGHIFSI